MPQEAVGASANDYVVLFDLAARRFWPHWMYLVVGFLGVLLAGRAALKKNAPSRVFAAIVALGFVIGATTGIAMQWNGFTRLRSAVARGDYVVVEGLVSNFRPDSWDGDIPERFTVEGHEFRFRRWEISSSFNRTVGAGGPDLTGQCVRVVFVQESGQRPANRIVWLGIRRAGCDRSTSRG
jgi:hypothetical protein